jgi:hypothetical protein
MGVVTDNGPLCMTGINSATNSDLAKNEYAGGRVHSFLETITVDVGDEATSTYTLAVLPREAVLLPTTVMRFDGTVTGTMDVGDVSNPDGLVDGYACSANTTVWYGAPASTSWVPGAADMGKPLWQLLGYASRTAAPAQIELYATLVGTTQASAAGVGYFNFQFTLPG